MSRKGDFKRIRNVQKLTDIINLQNAHPKTQRKTDVIGATVHPVKKANLIADNFSYNLSYCLLKKSLHNIAQVKKILYFL